MAFYSGNTSNRSSHSKFPLPSFGNETVYTAGQDEPFEMTDNPVNAEYEVTQSSQLAIPPVSYNEFFDDTRVFPPGDSVSQVIMTSQSQNMFDNYYTQDETNQSFDYTDNTCYEVAPFERDSKSQSEPPTQSCNQLPIYENQSLSQSNKPPIFSIVANGQRGAVREQVEFKKR